MKIEKLRFNAFEENTYFLYDDTGECIIIDPGCSNPQEEQMLTKLISDKGLNPVKLVNTHCHIDHVFGVNFVHQTYGLELVIHQGEQVVLDYSEQVGKMYGVPIDPIDVPTSFIDEGDEVRFGSTMLQVFFTPGHSPASICLYHEATGQLIAGDVLFQGSIGRSDLPGGDYDTLIRSIKTKLLPLPDDVMVYPGHGPITTIGIERETNPFLADS